MRPMTIGIIRPCVLPSGLDCRQMEPILSRTVGTTDAHLKDLAILICLYRLGFTDLALRDLD